jgi:hypothetical protein
MDGVEVILQATLGERIVDAERYDGPFVLERMGDLYSDVARTVGVIRENQHHHATGSNCLQDRLCPISSRSDVSWCDPTPDTCKFQPVAHSIGGRFILTGMTEKNVVRHRCPVSLLSL